MLCIKVVMEQGTFYYSVFWEQLTQAETRKQAVFSFFRFDKKTKIKISVRLFVSTFCQKNENQYFSSFIRFLVLTERNEFTTQYLVSAGGRVLLLASVLH